MKLIIAIDNKGVLGNKGKLPWRLPDDLEHFKKETLGSTLIMGAKTFASLPGILPNRKHVVLSRKLKSTDKITVYDSVDKMLAELTDQNVYLIGGADVIEQLFPYVTEAIITHVNTDVKEYDTIIDLDLTGFSLCSDQFVERSKNSHSFNIRKYTRD